MKRFLLVLTILYATIASADINVTLAPGASATSPAIATGLQSVTSISADTTITVACSGGIDCSFVAVKVDNKSIPLSIGTTRNGKIPLSFVSSSGSALHITTGADAKEVAGAFQLLLVSGTPADQGTPGNPAQAGAAADVLVEVQNPCDRVRFNPSYSQIGNRAHFVVTTGGSIIQHPDGPVDENDVVVFHVVSTNEDQLRNIEVSRISPTRTTGDLNLLGNGQKFSPQQRSNVCFERQFELGDFGPGEGKVELATVNNGQRTVTGTTTFTVDRLWDGIISFGPAWSHVADDTYGLAANAAGQNVIIKTAGGHNDVVYIVQYTQYMWGRRDVEKSYPGYQHFNPSIGFALTDFKQHAFAGVSFDWRQFVFTAGAHLAHVTRLAGDTKVGSVFTGAANTIPTTKKWQSGAYFSVTVDARAAKALLSAVGQ